MPFFDPLVNQNFAVFADYINCVNGGSVTDCGIYVVEPCVHLD